VGEARRRACARGHRGAIRFVLRREGPVLDKQFHLPTKRKLDLPLTGGSAVFGIGWGIAGNLIARTLRRFAQQPVVTTA